jgi:hypothetical protein
MALDTPCPFARIFVENNSEVDTHVVQKAAIIAIQVKKLKAINHDQ